MISGACASLKNSSERLIFTILDTRFYFKGEKFKFVPYRLIPVLRFNFVLIRAWKNVHICVWYIRTPNNLQSRLQLEHVKIHLNTNIFIFNLPKAYANEWIKFILLRKWSEKEENPFPRAKNTSSTSIY